jgi:hypothetical protein
MAYTYSNFSGDSPSYNEIVDVNGNIRKYPFDGDLPAANGASGVPEIDLEVVLPTPSAPRQHI